MSLGMNVLGVVLSIKKACVACRCCRGGNSSDALRLRDQSCERLGVGDVKQALRFRFSNLGVDLDTAHLRGTICVGF